MATLIKCGACKGRHTTVARVRECFDELYAARELCVHNLSASLCRGPAHYATEDEILRGF